MGKLFAGRFGDCEEFAGNPLLHDSAVYYYQETAGDGPKMVGRGPES